VAHVEVGTKIDQNQSNIDQKSISTWESILTLIFCQVSLISETKIEQVGKENLSKIDLNLGRPLGIDFSWILFDFGGQDGAKLGGSIDEKSIPKCLPKFRSIFD